MVAPTLVKLWVACITITALSTCLLGIFQFQSYDSRFLLNTRRFSLINEEIIEQICNDTFTPWTNNALQFTDNNELHSFIPFVHKGNRWGELANRTSICLASHSTIDKLYWVAQQALLWEGMMSVSVFVPGNDFGLVQAMIDLFHKCFPNIQENVSFHFAYPLSNQANFETRIQLPGNNFTCGDVELVNKLLMECRSQNDIESITNYPQNLMRNVARSGCPTSHILNVDVDMIVSRNLQSEIDTFLKDNELCETCAYIVPVYEIKKNVKFPPENKTMLLNYIRDKMAQQFHIKAYAKNQGNSNLKRWEKMPSKEEAKVNILYDVATYEEYWEPIVIIHSSAPHFDERFIGYGFTRNSQILHMKAKNFTFHVLDNSFLSHLGFQSSSSYSKIRKQQIRKNAVLYAKFKKELSRKYSLDFIPKKRKNRNKISKNK